MTTSHSARDITVIGGSAGGLHALRTILAALPRDYPAAVFVVLHVAPDSPFMLPDLLDRSSPLPVTAARDAAPIRPGRVVIAPPDQHLILEPERARLVHGPRENSHRPSIDVLFRSAAVAHGPRVTGVVLTGMLDDGAAGLWAIKRRGGATLVQDPASAEFPDMPRNALDAADAEHSVALEGIAAKLVELASKPVVASAEPPPSDMVQEVLMAENRSSIDKLDAIGRRETFTCPECSGSLWEVQGGGGPRFRCHVGHAYSMRTLAADQATRVEAALWAALRSLKENQRLAIRLAGEARERGRDRSAQWHAERAQSDERHSEVLRELLAEATAPSSPDLAGQQAAD
ncbi:MAG TPA: chemotaxis protein CheB [Casimicrobiaceae bacterium]|nr:chemotaxis protein CheB [Casimicrobiaceae bacterium]